MLLVPQVRAFLTRKAFCVLFQSLVIGHAGLALGALLAAELLDYFVLTLAVSLLATGELLLLMLLLLLKSLQAASDALAI